ncbi:MAG: hypothetical protein K9H16_08270 [Bacteroidales bacterium]|nr:hypothetical protein [Bacteroidales bacterium]
MKNLVFCLIILLFLGSCATKKEYYQTQQINTIEAYEHFLNDNPDSKFSAEAQLRLNNMKDEKAWTDAITQHTTESIKGYLSVYPNGAHKPEAEKTLKKLEEVHDWNEALDRNSIDGFESFIVKYPSSVNKSRAEEKLFDLKLENAWEKVKDTEEIEKLELFRNDFPESRYNKECINLIDYLKTYHLDWENLLQSPSIGLIQMFLEKYDGMNLADKAKQKLAELDEFQWETASQADDIENYEEYLELLPGGLHADEAEKRIIDLEVKKVFGGRYGSMPPMDKLSSNGFYDTNEIEVFNNTSYTLTILYSGANSKRIDIEPKQKMNFELPNGKYKVAAWVSTASVGKFAGTENLEGGSYSVEYYISTSYY